MQFSRATAMLLVFVAVAGVPLSSDPTAVVTLKDLAKQIDASTEDVPDLEKTDLKHAVRFFEKSFIDPLLKSLHKGQRDEKEQQAAMVGDF